MKTISGKLFFREAGSANGLLPSDGKKLMIVVGVVAVPEESTLKGEHQYVVVGAENKDLTILQLNVYLQHGIDMTEVACGSTVDGMLRAKIWQV